MRVGTVHAHVCYRGADRTRHKSNLDTHASNSVGSTCCKYIRTRRLTEEQREQHYVRSRTPLTCLREYRSESKGVCV